MFMCGLVQMGCVTSAQEVSVFKTLYCLCDCTYCVVVSPHLYGTAFSSAWISDTYVVSSTGTCNFLA